MKIKPSAKIHRRYFLLRGGGRRKIEEIILEYIGVLGWARAACVFVVGRGAKGEVILAVDRKSVEDVRAAFEVSDSEIRIVKVSGTLKGLSKSKKRCATTA